MSEYGVWLKDEATEKLVYTGTMNDAYRYAAIEQEKDESLKDRWRIGLLPQFRVSMDTPDGEKFVGAFESKEEAVEFTTEFLRENSTKTVHVNY